MRIDLSFPQEFTEIYNKFHQSEKGLKLLELEGFSRKHFDLPQMSREYFTQEYSADVSIDSNANSNDGESLNHNNYQSELTKPLLKLENYYLIFRELEKQHGTEKAQDLLGKIIDGTYYFHDSTAAQIPYSYHQDTSIIVRIDGDIKLLTMKRLMELYEDNIVCFHDRDQIDFNDLDIITRYKRKLGSCGLKEEVLKTIGKKKLDIEIFGGNSWKKMDIVLRHKRHNELYCLRTEDGRLTVVTADHPVILENNETKLAKELNTEDVIKICDNKIHFNEKYDIDKDLAYLIGFIIGDGHFRGNTINISQNKGIIFNKIVEIIKKLNLNYNIYTENNKNFGIRINESKFGEYLKNNFYTGSKCFDKQLPDNILEWSKESIISLISGIIDSDGFLLAKGVSITLSNLGLIQQLYTIMKNFDNKFISCKFGKTYRDNSQYKATTPLNYAVYFVPNEEICDLFKKYSIKMKDYSSNEYDIKSCNKFIVGKIDKIFKIDVDHPTYEYVYDVTVDDHVFYSNGLIQHNCYAFSTSRLINEGRRWGQLHSIPPKRAKSFMAQVIETVMDLSQEFAGAITPADLIVNYAYYAKKEKLSPKYIEQDFQSFVHIVNNKYRVSAQSPFTNISLFDRNNLELMFGDYMYPDASTPDFDYILELQEIFANFFSKGDPLTGLPYRFPVCTFTLLIDKEKGYELDQSFLKMVSKYNYEKGNFNIYLSNSAGKVASCCRLTNDFNLLTGINSFGAGAAISIGSHRVVSINLPRLGILYRHQHGKFDREKFFKMLDERMDDVHELLKAHRSLLHKRSDKGFLKFVKPHKYIDIDKSLFSTFGLAGINELMYNLFSKELVDEFGINEDVKEIEKEIIEYMNTKAMEYAKAEQLPYNLEQVPGESLAVKFAQKDSIMFGNIQEFELYSNQFIPLDKEIDIYDRIKIESEFCKSLSGGAIAHLNISSQLPNPESMEKLILFALQCGLEHFVVNLCHNVCENEHVSVGTLEDERCPVCGTDIVESLTRVVGYFTFKSSWNKVRREKEHRSFTDIY